MEFVLAVLLGIAGGVLSGIIPGVGATIVVVLLMPVLLAFEPVYILVSFVSLYSISQYIGSVPAIILGVPGEISSMAAVTESKEIIKQHRQSEAIAHAALGSLFGGIICLAFVVIGLDILNYLAIVFKTPIKFTVLVLLIAVTAIVADNRGLINVCLMILGAFFGVIGIHGTYNREFLTFDNPNLMTGLPLFPVLLCLFVLPTFYKIVSDNKNFQAGEIVNITINFSQVKSFFKDIGSAVRGTVLGFFGGFCPGITCAFSSQLAYVAEKIKHKKSEHCVKRVTAAETANNAGALSALLPMIVLGIPISSSEAVVLTILQMKNFTLNFSNFQDMLLTTTQALVITNIVGVLLAWPFARQLLKLLTNIHPKRLYSVLFTVLIVFCVYVGYINYQAEFYIIVILALLPVGWLLRKLETLPLILSFMLVNMTIDSVVTVVELYS